MEGGLFSVVGVDSPENGQKDVLGQVHGVLPVSGLAVSEAIDFIVVRRDQRLCRGARAVPLGVTYPLYLLVHCLAAVSEKGKEIFAAGKSNTPR